MQLNQSDVHLLPSNSLLVHLPHRKNWPHGHTFTRSCTCSRFLRTCPHRAFLWLLTLSNPHRDRLTLLSPRVFSNILRFHLERLRVPEASSYTGHAFRRGHAEDLARFGCDISAILAAGGWRSRLHTIHRQLGVVDK